MTQTSIERLERGAQRIMLTTELSIRYLLLVKKLKEESSQKK